jgi:predicted O-linked N-acetylglucosamine transferase (SPINDLY family)
MLEKVTEGQVAVVELVETAGYLSDSGQATLARQLYKMWLSSNHDDPWQFAIHFNCSTLESQLGNDAEAVESLKQAIALKPDFIPPYINLGVIFERAGAVEQAIGLWRTAVGQPIPINGDALVYATTALKQIARVCSNQQLSDAALEAMELCLDVDPNQHDVLQQYVAMRLRSCKWPVMTRLKRLDRRTLMKNVHPLSMMYYTDDPLLHLAAADHYSKNFDPPTGNGRIADRRDAAIELNTRRLRVGYVSSDLRDHAIGYLMAELFELHNKERVEVFAYYCGSSSASVLKNRIKTATEHWTDIRDLTDDEAARAIANDRIDILIDLNGHTSDARTGVFAHRPAPVQVNWLGYPGTMGTPYHHYIIADEWIIPPDSEMYYSEKVVRLPCYQPSDRKREMIVERLTRHCVGLPEEAFVYCCFNGTQKISRFTFERWLAILREAPHSVLWILDTGGQTKESLGNLAEQSGVSRVRLIFAPRSQSAFHLARYQLADLVLDTTPYGAHTTARTRCGWESQCSRYRGGALRRASAAAWCALQVSLS